MKYTVVYERTGTGYSAYVPDLPGCVAAGATRAKVAAAIRLAIAMHLEALREDRQKLPRPGTWTELVEAG